VRSPICPIDFWLSDSYRNSIASTVKVGNFDHLATFKIILKIFPNSFLTIFLHENVRVLWYFWDPNLKTRFGSQKYHIF
jgi:hypothetical protein